MIFIHLAPPLSLQEVCSGDAPSTTIGALMALAIDASPKEIYREAVGA
jgi:hypothetical protein